MVSFSPSDSPDLIDLVCPSFCGFGEDFPSSEGASSSLSSRFFPKRSREEIASSFE